eukprot:1980213-Pyramimonas_sp.AAC.1
MVELPARGSSVSSGIVISVCFSVAFFGSARELQSYPPPPGAFQFGLRHMCSRACVLVILGLSVFSSAAAMGDAEDGWGNRYHEVFLHCPGSAAAPSVAEPAADDPLDGQAAAESCDVVALRRAEIIAVSSDIVVHHSFFGNACLSALAGDLQYRGYYDRSEFILAQRELMSRRLMMKATHQTCDASAVKFSQRLAEIAIISDRWLRAQLVLKATSADDIEPILFTEFVAYDETPMQTSFSESDEVVLCTIHDYLSKAEEDGVALPDVMAEPVAPREIQHRGAIKDSPITKLFQVTTWVSMLLRVRGEYKALRVKTVNALSNVGDTSADVLSCALGEVVGRT